MAWEKVPPAHAEAFARALPPEPDVELKQMFGCPAGFAGGHMFCGAHERNMIVRLPDDAREALIAEGGSPFTPLGRPMKAYACVPASRVTDVRDLRWWFVQGLALVRTMPVKPPKPPGRLSKVGTPSARSTERAASRAPSTRKSR